MHWSKSFFLFCFLVFSLCFALEAEANNLTITNISLEDRDINADTVVVEFDISWDNSWRDTVNFDAVWVFLKACVDSCTDGHWDHGDLYTAGVNPKDTSPGTNMDLDVIVVPDKAGAFIQRRSTGAGTTFSRNVRLTMDYNSTGATDSSTIKVKALGIEMVYIPEGDFYIGDGNGTSESTDAFFKDGGPANTAFHVTTTALAVSSDNTSTNNYALPVTVDADGGIEDNVSWPTGYKPFYLMKYELSQAQYRDFLNMLDRDEQTNRVAEIGTADDYAMTDATTVTNRDTIRLPSTLKGGTDPEVFGCDYAANSSSGNGVFDQADDGEGIAMNYLDWMDFVAYADWAGLRPMTELEYEKAARGPRSAVYAEYAWGSTALESATTALTDAGKATEVPNQGNLNYASVASDYDGPFRVGAFAGSGTSRKTAGAGYYGNLELSGNLSELIVFLGDDLGQAFKGTHGDGTLITTASYEGNATNLDWPGIDGTTDKGVTGSDGGGERGGDWDNVSAESAISYRYKAGDSTSIRRSNKGGRYARTSPYAGPETVIFETTTTNNGDFDSGSGARTGADAFCVANKPGNLPLGCANIHALLSISASDEIRDMPALYGFNQFGPAYFWNNTEKTFNMLAFDWQDMFDSSILLSMQSGTGSSNTAYWTGASSMGGLIGAGTHCVGWTDGTLNHSGTKGDSTVTDGTWLETGSSKCSTTQTILCACKYDVE